MRLHRFIYECDLQDVPLIVTSAEFVNQIKNVLRLQIGDQLIISDGKGRDGQCVIEDMQKEKVRLSVQKIWQNECDPKKNITLYCALLKNEHFDLVVEKATELGVRTIVPIISERTIKKNIKTDRLQKIIREATEQSGRSFVPTIEPPLKFNECYKKAIDERSFILFFDKTGTSLKNAISLIAGVENVAVFIGPEGGWGEKELGFMLERSEKDKEIAIVSFGQRTLRAETAAIAAVFLVSENS